VRDILVTLLFLVGAFAALKRPFIGGMLWVWIGLMNPHRLGWGFAYDLPFALAAAAVTFLGIFFNSKDFRWLGGGPVRVLILLLLWMCATTASAILVDASLDKLVDFLKVMVMTFVVGSLVITRQQIVALIVVVTGSIAFFGVKGGIFTILTGGAFRVWGPPSSLVNGNNELALALVITIPFMYFLAKEIHLLREIPILKKISPSTTKMLVYVCIVLCTVAAIGSQSRGAFLAIVAMGALLWWRSKSKASLGIALIVVAPALFLFMPQEWFDRMQTIENYQQDSSALGRLAAWKMAINIANDRVTGAGFATANPVVYSLYAPEAKETLVAHSIYFQILGDHGYIGLSLYLLFWWLTYRAAIRLRKIGAQHEELGWVHTLGSMATVSIAGFAVGGAFLSLAYWDMPYYIMVILLVTERYAKSVIARSMRSDSNEHEANGRFAVGHQRAPEHG
jgi:probable O-glycosylation ligase (exosortase A-associated)